MLLLGLLILCFFLGRARVVMVRWKRETGRWKGRCQRRDSDARCVVVRAGMSGVLMRSLVLRIGWSIYMGRGRDLKRVD